MTTIRACRVSGYDAAQNAGDFWLTATRIQFMCPCGCGYVASINYIPELAGGGAWDWDGDSSKPTVKPSINIKDHWHGFLENGVFRSC
jgi:hypothetical protein